MDMQKHIRSLSQSWFHKNKIGFFILFGLFIFFLNCSIKPAIEEEVLTSQIQANENELKLNGKREELSQLYLNQVQPIFNQRCVVCHACQESPCSLYLNSYEGVFRGARTDSSLLSSVFSNKPVRLKDGKTLKEWQEKGFAPVVNFEASEKNPEKNILFRYVDLAANHNVGEFSFAESEDFLEKEKFCPVDIKSAEQNFKAHPYIGMPFALPALTVTQVETLKKWAQSGSVGPSEKAKLELAAPSNLEPIFEWESFLNQNSPKAQLTARYIYEHVFMAHIHFDKTSESEYFELVRSSTSYPLPPDEIVTGRAYDDPGVDKFYYRFRKVTESIVRKTHVPMTLSRFDLKRWKKIFLESDWGAQNVGPVGYQSKNPFEYFKQIPARARYTFMLDKSYVLVNSMIRGSVCTGRKATYAIRDHFWALFLDPRHDPSVIDPEIGENEWIPLSVDKEDRSNIIKKFIKSDSDKFRYTTDMLWRGEGYNREALLTVFRHEVSASVHRGLIGKLPNTIWVLNFSNYERLFYNLVVEFMPWGSTAHQYSTWRMMTYHRQEAEERFLMFFPAKLRPIIRKRWDEGVSEYASHLISMKLSKNEPYKYDRSAYPVQNLMVKVISEMPEKVVENKNEFFLKNNESYQVPDQINSIEAFEAELARVNAMRSHKFAQYLPNIIYIKIEDRAYSILSNRSFRFNDMVLGQNLAYDPQFDSISIVRGLFGDRPELFIDLKLNEVSLFLKRLLEINNSSDWNEVKKSYAIRRNDVKIWKELDWFAAYDKHEDWLESGIIDMNQYDIKVW